MLELSIWGCQIQRRLLHEEQKKYLISVAVFLGFLIFIRTVKFVYTAEGTAINRMLWYLYYFPQIFSVLIMFFAVLHIGKPLEKKIDKKWKILYLPATLLVMLIMTNDRHQWAFGFPAGLKYANETYTHGVIYYAALIWMLVLFAAMLVVAMQRCAHYSSWNWAFVRCSVLAGSGWNISKIIQNGGDLLCCISSIYGGFDPGTFISDK